MDTTSPLQQVITSYKLGKRISNLKLTAPNLSHDLHAVYLQIWISISLFKEKQEDTDISWRLLSPAIWINFPEWVLYF